MIPCHFVECSHVSADEQEHYRHWVDAHPLPVRPLHGRVFEDYGPGL